MRPDGAAGLTAPVRYLRGVGEKRAQALSRLGIFTIEDLIFYFPRRYEDRRRLTPLSDLRPGMDAAVTAEVVSLSLPESPQDRSPASAMLTDGACLVRAVWFNPGQAKALAPQMRLALFGRVEYRGGIQLTNPEFEILTDQPPRITGRIVPVYPATASLTQRRLRGLIDTALEEYGGRLADYLPLRVRQKFGMKGLREALDELHHPSGEEPWIRARNRLAFDELFLLQAGLLLRRRSGGASRAPSLSLRPGEGSRRFLERLPFPPTGAQRRAIGEILRDMDRPEPMNRLLQGDVGSGKTLVAAAAILAAADSGAQSVFMVPTEILAQQHYLKLRDLFGPLGIRTALLTGGMRAGDRREALEAIQSGAARLVIGTHALFGGDVAFKELGLAVVDEQHRFGVLQKDALISRAASPHVLVMTATPIPRTLVLSVYGDLEVSVLDELPPGRKPVRTARLGPGDEPSLLALIRERAGQGQQAYWVCPLIDEGEGDLGAVTSCYGRLLRRLPGLRIEMLHGRLPMAEKEGVMRRFAAGEVDLLVATAIIEVGVDVPNASVIVIEDAGRFGLAQLHQLRGRVGRGEAESLCALLEGRGTSAEGRERIAAMCRTSDGFALAEADLRQRGPGEVCGVRQHGVTDFRVADLMRDRRILELARREAQALLEEDPTLRSEPLLRAELERRERLRLAGTA